MLSKPTYIYYQSDFIWSGYFPLLWPHLLTLSSNDHYASFTLPLIFLFLSQITLQNSGSLYFSVLSDSNALILDIDFYCTSYKKSSKIFLTKNSQVHLDTEISFWFLSSIFILLLTWVHIINLHAYCLNIET